jgi:hypothetical protein
MTLSRRPRCNNGQQPETSSASSMSKDRGLSPSRSVGKPALLPITCPTIRPYAQLTSRQAGRLQPPELGKQHGSRSSGRTCPLSQGSDSKGHGQIRIRRPVVPPENDPKIARRSVGSHENPTDSDFDVTGRFAGQVG